MFFTWISTLRINQILLNVKSENSILAQVDLLEANDPERWSFTLVIRVLCKKRKHTTNTCHSFSICMYTKHDLWRDTARKGGDYYPEQDLRIKTVVIYLLSSIYSNKVYICIWITTRFTVMQINWAIKVAQSWNSALKS